MLRTRLAALVASPLVVIGLAAAPASAHELTTTLSGANEVGPGGELGVGDPDGSGSAEINFRDGQREVCWEVSVSNLATVVGAHIHKAPAGTNGPVVVPISVGSGCATVARELGRDIKRNPEDYYVNVHTNEKPAGAVRGQLG